MKLWLISQDINNDYDTYSDAVVAAETEDQARMTHPYSPFWDGIDGGYTWVSSEDVKVKFIGTAIEGTEEGVICASFHAG